MSQQNNQLIICKNGHQQPVSGTKFCIYCGAPLNMLTFQENQSPAQNQQLPALNNHNPTPPPVNQPPANQAPVNQTPVNQQPPFQQNQQQPNDQNYQQPNNQNFQQNNQQFQQPNNQNYQQPNNPNFQPPNNQNFQQPNNQNFQAPHFIEPLPPPMGQQQNFQQQQYQQMPPQQQLQPMPYPPQQQAPPQYQMIQAMSCYTCGGDGHRLPPKQVICKDCNWLRPLIPGYQVDASAFEWAADGKAMSTLRSMKTLNAAARAVSEKVGRKWIESTFNSILLSEKQLPHIYMQAVLAARILGMSHMPDVYVSGERAWDCLTFGTDKDSFVVLGSAMAGNFQGPDLLFLLAREMGHCRAGHALWKTVIRFLLGEQGPGKNVMSGGFFNAILNPTALIEGAIEMPLLAWARQAEITADRAGLLAVGSEEVVRRVLLSWSLKSSMIFRQMNIEAWIEQQSEEDGGYSRLSELTTSSTPYIGPRLKVLSEFAKSQELQYWRKMITNALQQANPPKPPAPPAPPAPSAPTGAKLPAKLAAQPDIIKLKCANCQTVMQVPQKALEGKTELPVKCPNQKCGKITRLKKKAAPPPTAKAEPPKSRQDEENMNYGD